MDTIQIRGARTHNLKNIDLDLPRDRLIVITGLSGSGKSSLAFDTIYAEGQRRYVESLSAYARQFLSMMEKPDVDHIEGLSPAISIEQKSTSHNPRSTVGTITEIYDYLRLLFARVGDPALPAARRDRWRRRRSARWSTRCSPCPRTRRLMLLAPGGVGPQGRVPEAAAGAGARRASCAPASTATCCELDDGTGAGAAQEAHDRGGGGPLQGAARTCSSAWPSRSRPPSSWLAAWCGSRYMDDPDSARPAVLRATSPARSAATRSRSSSRGSSPSTTRSAPARAATALASSSSSIRRRWSCTRSCRWPPARCAAGTAATPTTSS